MSKHQTKRAAAVQKQAKLEMLLSKLSTDYEAATFHQNVVVADCLNKACAAMMMASNHLFANRLDQFLRVSNGAWLLIDFGRRLLDADAVEHLLGESEYLELNETVVSPTVSVDGGFADLEKEILKLRSVLRDRKKVD